MTAQQKKVLKLRSKQFSFISIHLLFIVWMLHSLYYVLPVSDQAFLMNLLGMASLALVTKKLGNSILVK